jgi:hypothetical protein
MTRVSMRSNVKELHWNKHYGKRTKKRSKKINHIVTIYKRLVNTSQKTRNMALTKFIRVKDVNEKLTETVAALSSYLTLYQTAHRHTADSYVTVPDGTQTHH